MGHGDWDALGPWGVVLDRPGLKMSVSYGRRGEAIRACMVRWHGRGRTERACAVTMKQRKRVFETLLGLQERKNVGWY